MLVRPELRSTDKGIKLEDLKAAQAYSPSFSSGAMVLSLVITAASFSPPWSVKLTSALTAPYATVDTVPANMLRALIFMAILPADGLDYS